MHFDIHPMHVVPYIRLYSNAHVPSRRLRFLYTRTYFNAHFRYAWSYVIHIFVTHNHVSIHIFVTLDHTPIRLVVIFCIFSLHLFNTHAWYTRSYFYTHFRCTRSYFNTHFGCTFCARWHQEFEWAVRSHISWLSPAQEVSNHSQAPFRTWRHTMCR